MSRLMGWGRYRTEAYPSSGTAGDATAAALRNRNVAAPTELAVPFTPNDSLIAAIAFTPLVSGVLQISGNVGLVNGVDAEQYVLAMTVKPGTGITVTGGAATSDGWVMGSTVPPVIGGTPGSLILALEDITPSLGNGGSGVFSAFGITPSALPLGVPCVVSVILTQVGGGHALASLAIFNLTAMELP